MTRQHTPCDGFGAGLTVATVLLLVAGCGGRSVWATDDGGAGHDGGSEVGECQVPGDCVVAWRANECCSCYEPVSAAKLAADPCLIPPEQSFVPEECWVDCFIDGDCAICPTHEWTPTCEDGVCIWLESDCTVPEDCLVGIWVNDCCTQAMPVRRAALLSEPCLVSWPIFEIPQQCRDQWAEECMDDCAFSGPQSRAVTCGIYGCAFATECYQPSDCTMVLDGNTFCPCPEAFPAEMIGRDECVVPVGTSIPAHCPANQTLADCVPCVEGGVPTCREYRCETFYATF